MARKELTAFRMDPDLMAALRAVKAKDGVPVAVQVDRAVRDWLRRRGVTLKTTARRKKGGG